MSPTVDLLTPELAKADATGNHTRLIREILEEHEIGVRIVVERDLEPDRNVVTLNKWKADAHLSVLQHSIGSEVAQHIIDRRIPVVVNYHNITPAHFFRVWQPHLANSAERGRRQLRRLAPLSRRAIADSEFNARELTVMGFEDVVVSPVLWRLGTRAAQGTSGPAPVAPDGGTVLFVGRIAPNKCHHDLISALAVLSRKRPLSRLVLVGDASPVEYLDCLRNLATRLGVEDQVVFAGKVPDKNLLRWYQQADVFACASEHEGFGVPLVEAMANGLPVVAYEAAAVAETVRGAGIVLSDKRPATLALAFDRVMGDEQLARALSDQGLRLAQRFDISVTGEQMWGALQDLI